MEQLNASVTDNDYRTVTETVSGKTLAAGLSLCLPLPNTTVVCEYKKL